MIRQRTQMLRVATSVLVRGARSLVALPRRPLPDVRFVDATKASGIAFVHKNSATSNKYLIETMGGGVALLDYDNDGRLDIFLTNGARIDDPMPAGKRPDKSDAAFWNRLYRQTPDGTFVDATEKAGLTGIRRTSTAWASRWGITTTTGSKTST